MINTQAWEDAQAAAAAEQTADTIQQGVEDNQGMETISFDHIVTDPVSEPDFERIGGEDYKYMQPSEYLDHNPYSPDFDPDDGPTIDPDDVGFDPNNIPDPDPGFNPFGPDLGLDIDPGFNPFGPSDVDPSFIPDLPDIDPGYDPNLPNIDPDFDPYGPEWEPGLGYVPEQDPDVYNPDLSSDPGYWEVDPWDLGSTLPEIEESYGFGNDTFGLGTTDEYMIDDL